MYNQENYCNNCEYFDFKYGVCKRMDENIRDYPEKFLKCNGKYFKLIKNGYFHLDSEAQMNGGIIETKMSVDSLKKSMLQRRLMDRKFQKRYWTAQRIILLIGIVILTINLLFPPWQYSLKQPGNKFY
jgi:hypothetical protein